MSIILYEKVDFINLLDEIRLTSSDIENSPVLAKYQRISIKNGAAEAVYPLAMVPPFYRFIIENNRLPEQDEYWDALMLEYKLFIGKDIASIPQEIYEGYKSRALSRTYPSLIRDLHLNLKLKETVPPKVKIVYNTALDLEVGIDVLIIDEREEHPIRIGLCLYIDSYKSNKERERKKGKWRPYHNFIYRELPITINYEDNNIQLYNNELLNRIFQIINNPNQQ